MTRSLPRFVGRQFKKQKSRLQFLKWRLKTLKNRNAISDILDADRVQWINPDRIKCSMDSPALNRLEAGETAPKTPYLERGLVLGGDWDSNLTEFETQDVWQAFVHRFKSGGKWCDTAFYDRVVKTIEGGVRMWGCSTSDELKDRLKGIDELYDEIRVSGYKTQARSPRPRPAPARSRSPPTV